MNGGRGDFNSQMMQLPQQIHRLHMTILHG